MLLLFRTNFARSGIIAGGPITFSLFSRSVGGAADVVVPATDARRFIVICCASLSLSADVTASERRRSPAADVPVVDATLTLFPDAAMYAAEARYPDACTESASA